MTAIAADPSNAQAINDLAVAIATTWLSEPTVVPSVFEPNPTVEGAPDGSGRLPPSCSSSVSSPSRAIAR